MFAVVDKRVLRVIKKYHIKDTESFKNKLLHWSNQFYEVIWLDSNDYPQKHKDFDAILAVDAFTLIKTDSQDAFNQLKEYQSTIKDWLFGYLTYDLKNDTEHLHSNNLDELDFPELFFFQPKKVFLLKGNELEVQYLNMVNDELEEDFNEINNFELNTESKEAISVKVQMRITKDNYFKKLDQILKHISRGDIYEVNFCQEFYAQDIEINPLQIYLDLNQISKPPFATYLKLDDHYLMSASPERYLKKVDQKIISQPIKGTAKRALNLEEDELLKKNLAEDEKERSENIMIVDLVRNDLSKTAMRGTVKVEELCKIYTFEQVHQMISTVVSEIDYTKSPVEVLRTTFPMGSMTGAPKVSAMKIIEEQEVTKRGLYSGAVGYFDPQNNFDFNVIIRSILYNAAKKYASFSVGGAITAKSVPEKEYEECLIKAKAMRQVLEGLNTLK